MFHHTLLRLNKSILYVACVLTAMGTQAQSSDISNSIGDYKSALSIQWELPVQYGLRYDYKFSNRISGSIQTGLLSEPNSSTILSTLEVLGTDQITVLLIESAFQSGLTLEEGVNYHFKRNYIGLFSQQIFLVGEETPLGTVEILLEEDLSTAPRRQGRNEPIGQTLTLRSNLFQLGFQFGRIFPIGDTWHILSEIGFSFNVGANGSLESEQLELSRVSVEMDAYLDDIYANYALIPSITVGIAKKFK